MSSNVTLLLVTKPLLSSHLLHFSLGHCNSSQVLKSLACFFLIGYATVWILFLDIILVSTVSGADELFLHLSVLALIHLWVYCPCSINVNAFSSECPTDQTWSMAKCDVWWYVIKRVEGTPLPPMARTKPTDTYGRSREIFCRGYDLKRNWGPWAPSFKLASLSGNPKNTHSLKLPVTYNALFYL